MRRRVFNFFAILSAMVFLLAAGLWASTFFREIALTSETYDPASGRFTSRAVDVLSGRLMVSKSVIQFSSSAPYPARAGRPHPWKLIVGPRRNPAIAAYDQGWNLYVWMSWKNGMRLGLGKGPWAITDFYAGVRLLAVIPVAAILPGYWIYQFTRRRRQRTQGCCACCGYDLRATPEGGGQLLEVCPECGRPAGVAPVG